MITRWSPHLTLGSGLRNDRQASRATLGISTFNALTPRLTLAMSRSLRSEGTVCSVAALDKFQREVLFRRDPGQILHAAGMRDGKRFATF